MDNMSKYILFSFYAILDKTHFLHRFILLIYFTYDLTLISY